MLGWREVPVDPEHCGRTAGACRPVIRQLFVGAGDEKRRTAAGPRPQRQQTQRLQQPWG